MSFYSGLFELISLLILLFLIFFIIIVIIRKPIIILNHFTKKEIIKVTSTKPLWKQPTGLILLLGIIVISLTIIILLLETLYFIISNSHNLLFTIFFPIVGLFGIVVIIYSFIREFRDLKLYFVIKKSLQNGCSCGSSEFNVYTDIICSNCNRILFENKSKKNSLISFKLNVLNLMSEMKKVLNVEYITNLSRKELYNFYINPIPKRFWKKFGIKEMIVLSDTHRIALFKGSGICDSTIIKKQFPKKIIFKLILNNSVKIIESITFSKDGEETLVHHNMKYPVKIPNLVMKKEIQKGLKMTIKHLSDELGKPFNIVFVYDDSP